MSCPGFAPEDYQLYALGLSEPEETEEIRTHLADGCGTCTAELRRSVVFWYQFAVTEAEDSSAQPRPELRRKILESVSGTPIREHRIPRWSRPWAVAAAITLAFVSGLSWYIGNQGFMRRSRPASVAVTQPPAVPTQAEPNREEVRTLRERLER